MKRQDIYTLLEEKMVPYDTLVAMPRGDSQESLVAIPQTKVLRTRQIEPAMLAITGTDIYVRKTVADMLDEASRLLAGQSDGLQLEIVYGYRHPSIQLANFEKLKRRLEEEHPDYTTQQIFTEAFRYVADLEVAGHPTGSSVDVCVLRNGEPIDMGTKNREFVPDTYVFSPFISAEAWHNRQLLRQVMIRCGFAPYDGEWWHFSYGDREWAVYYNQPRALYGPLEFTVLP